jgi:DNA-binding MarR family transcriptional regulator
MSSKIKSQEETKQDISPSKVHALYPLFHNTDVIISRARELELASFGLTLEHGVLLHSLIKMGGSATLDEITEKTMRQYHSVSTLVNRMARLGLLKKVKYSDKKKFQVSITDKGLSLYNQATCNSLNMIFSVLSPEDQKTFAKYLQLLIDKARNLLGLDHKHPFLS